MSTTNGVKFKTKMNIFFIVLKLLLCVAIMVASTYALFMDGSDVGVLVTAGDIDVSLLKWDDGEDKYIPISTVQGSVFGDELWEPGQTRIIFLKVENHSNIPIKYILQMTNVTMNDLDGAFVYCVFNAEEYDTRGQSWEGVSEGREIYTLADGTNPVSGKNHIYLDEDGSAYYALALHMLEEGSDVYQDKTSLDEACFVDINLFAVQGNADVDTQGSIN